MVTRASHAHTLRPRSRPRSRSRATSGSSSCSYDVARRHRLAFIDDDACPHRRARRACIVYAAGRHVLLLDALRRPHGGCASCARRARVGPLTQKPACRSVCDRRRRSSPRRDLSIPSTACGPRPGATRARTQRTRVCELVGTVLQEKGARAAIDRPPRAPRGRWAGRLTAYGRIDAVSPASISMLWASSTTAAEHAFG